MRIVDSISVPKEKTRVFLNTETLKLCLTHPQTNLVIFTPQQEKFKHVTVFELDRGGWLFLGICHNDMLDLQEVKYTDGRYSRASDVIKMLDTDLSLDSTVRTVIGYLISDSLLTIPKLEKTRRYHLIRDLLQLLDVRNNEITKEFYAYQYGVNIKISLVLNIEKDTISFTCADECRSTPLNLGIFNLMSELVFRSLGGLRK